MHTLLAFWRGRASRREYWPSLAGYLVFYGLLVVLMGPGLASLLGFPFWMVIGARRLHDFGANALWAALPFGIGFVGGFARGLGAPVPPTGTGGSYDLVLAALSILLIVALGIVPGRRSPGAAT